MSAELHAIPFEDRYILYRPLRRRAFIGNAAMADYVSNRLAGAPSPGLTDIEEFLEVTGFLDPDPPGPPIWAADGPYKPTMAVLLMTSACNLRCTYCYARGGEDSRLRMTTPVARKAIDAAFANARELGRDHWSLAFHGPGEPTSNWRVLVDAVTYAKSLGMPCRISISTNGVFGEAKRDFILRNFTGVSLSFDGIREVQDGQRPLANGGGSFDAVVRTIAAFDRAGLRYGARLTTTPATFRYLPDSIEWLCDNTDCTAMQVEPAYCGERGKYEDPTPELAEAFAQAFIAAYQVAAAAGRRLTYSGARPWLITGAFCRAPQEAFVVTPEADLVTCYETTDSRHALYGDFTVGRIGPTGIEVDQDKLRAFAAKQEERRALCRGCFCYWHCGGDCATKCWSATDPNRGRCQVNRTVTRDLLAHYVANGDGVWRGEEEGRDACAGCGKPRPKKPEASSQKAEASSQ